MDAANLTPDEVQWVRDMAKLQGGFDQGLSRDLETADRNFRAAFFAHVDRVALARIKEIMPGLLANVSDNLKSATDPEQITKRAEDVRRHCDETIAQTRQDFTIRVNRLVEDALDARARYSLEEMAKRAKVAIGDTVSNEVARQLCRFLKMPAAKLKAKAKGRAR